MTTEARGIASPTTAGTQPGAARTAAAAVLGRRYIFQQRPAVARHEPSETAPRSVTRGKLLLQLGETRAMYRDVELVERVGARGCRAAQQTAAARKAMPVSTSSPRYTRTELSSASWLWSGYRAWMLVAGRRDQLAPVHGAPDCIGLYRRRQLLARARHAGRRRLASPSVG